MELRKKTKTYEMDMCSGPIFVKIVVFAIPLILFVYFSKQGFLCSPGCPELTL